jgi:hypothetical protein
MFARRPGNRSVAQCVLGVLTACLLALAVAPAGASAASYKYVEAGGSRTCAIQVSGAMNCWGRELSGVPQPAGTFTQVALGDYHSCAIRTDATMACWGTDYNGSGVGRSLPGTWTQISAGFLHNCAMAGDGELVCWGDNVYGARDPILGEYTQTSVDAFYSCGVRKDGEIACWGTGDGKQYCEQQRCTPKFLPPAGPFTQVSTGFVHACGLRADATIACWGDNKDGRATPPFGTFKQLDAGDDNTCAIRTDGTVACWGDNSFGQSTPLPGTFTQISSSGANACGIRTDAEVVCWGGEQDGQSTPRVGPDVTKPVLTSLKLKKSTFKAGSVPPADPNVAPKNGTTALFVLSETATVTFRIARRAGGRKVGGVCRTPARKNRTRPACDLTLAGSFQQTGFKLTTQDPGTNEVRVAGRLGRSALPPGKYLLVGTPTDFAGNKGAAVKVPFTIIR